MCLRLAVRDLEYQFRAALRLTMLDQVEQCRSCCALICEFNWIFGSRTRRGGNRAPGAHVIEVLGPGRRHHCLPEMVCFIGTLGWIFPVKETGDYFLFQRADEDEIQVHLFFSWKRVFFFIYYSFVWYSAYVFTIARLECNLLTTSPSIAAP